jgi:hypothetical protein
MVERDKYQYGHQNHLQFLKILHAKILNEVE